MGPISVGIATEKPSAWRRNAQTLPRQPATHELQRSSGRPSCHRRRIWGTGETLIRERAACSRWRRRCSSTDGARRLWRKRCADTQAENRGCRILSDALGHVATTCSRQVAMGVQLRVSVEGICTKESRIVLLRALGTYFVVCSYPMSRMKDLREFRPMTL